MLELDPRIKDVMKIKSILNADNSLVGKTGYFTTNLNAFKDLSLCPTHGIIIKIDFDFNTNDNIFIVKDDMGVVVSERYFIADEDVKPVDKYAPFRTIGQFLEHFTIGDVIKFRKKGYSYNYERSMLTGVKFIDCCCYAYIGSDIYTFTDLFDNYELYLDDTVGWIPFGVKIGVENND